MYGGESFTSFLKVSSGWAPAHLVKVDAEKVKGAEKNGREVERERREREREESILRNFMA